jgi:nucleotide-binding universal stress UspA family protein
MRPIPRFDEVLVPLDGSPTAERALVPGVDLASRTGVPLRVLRRALADEKEEAAEYLDAVAARYVGRTNVRTRLVDMEAIPDAITVATSPGTLVCMASHGRGRREALLGSVTEVVLRSLRRPVLVVGPKAPAVTTLRRGRVIACLDGSELAERTLGPAKAWARCLGRPLWLAQVAPSGVPVEGRSGGDVVEAGALAALAREVGGVEGWDVLHDRDVPRALAAMAEDWPAALLVMATHGRSGWDRLRLGSATATTIHRAPAPVLVVPAAG